MDFKSFPLPIFTSVFLPPFCAYIYIERQGKFIYIVYFVASCKNALHKTFKL